MPSAHIDHLVVTAPSLAAGVAYVRERLGVSPQPGGQHPRMGTHNCVLRLGPACYLEVIAVDPQSGTPEFPRWFQLDQACRRPRLAAWIARTDALRAATTAWAAFGRIESMTRGALRWEIALPEGGALPYDGVAPMLIQWQGPHPAGAMADSGCSLISLEGRHPQAPAIEGLLRAIGLQPPVPITLPGPGQPPHLVARFQTRSGPRVLDASESPDE